MKPLLFLHGFTGSAKSWDKIRNKLKYPSLAIDIPGHGKNYFKDLSNSYTFDNWNEDFLSIINHQKSKKINLCGYSMGGRLAISFAVAHPERIESLILVSTTAGIKNNSKKKLRLNENLELSFRILKDYPEFITYWENLDFFSIQKSRNRNGFKIQREIRLSQNPQQLSFALQNLGTGNMPNYWDKISKFNFPVLIICGDKDSKYCEISKDLKSNILNSHLEIIQNSGHAPHIDQQLMFTKIIQKFIKS